MYDRVFLSTAGGAGELEHNLRFSHRVFGWVAATVLGGSTYELFLDTSGGEVTTSRAAVAQGGGCSAVVSVQRACNPTEMAAAGHAPRAPTRAQSGAERSGLDKPGLVWTRGGGGRGCRAERTPRLMPRRTHG